MIKIDMTGWVMKDHGVPNSKITVLGRDFEGDKKHKNGRPYWKCKCDCGRIFSASGISLRNGNTKSCGCLAKIDMTGWRMKEHGVPDSRITVIKRDYRRQEQMKSGVPYWECQCECGKIFTSSAPNIRRGQCKSCGCLQKEKAGYVNMAGWIMKEHGVPDSRITVIGRNDSYIKEKNIHTNDIYYDVVCECGAKFTASRQGLVLGTTKSCGCLNRERIADRGFATRKNITGQRFGRLVALEVDFNKTIVGKGTTYWRCRCDCGNIVSVRQGNLHCGDVQSCGCLGRSRGEALIEKILRENKIPFQKEKAYSDLYNPETGGTLRFDFFVNNEFLLEFDGRQHYETAGIGWFANNHLEEQQYKDGIKNSYCSLKHIPLKRIPYTDINKITLENIMNDTYLVKEL